MNIQTVVTLEEMRFLHKEMVRINQYNSGEVEWVRDSRGEYIRSKEESKVLLYSQRRVYDLAKRLMRRYEEFGDKVNMPLFNNFETFLSTAEDSILWGKALGDKNYARLLNLTSSLAYNVFTLRQEWFIETNYWGDNGFTPEAQEFGVQPRSNA